LGELIAVRVSLHKNCTRHFAARGCKGTPTSRRSGSCAPDLRLRRTSWLRTARHCALREADLDDTRAVPHWCSANDMLGESPQTSFPGSKMIRAPGASGFTRFNLVLRRRRQPHRLFARQLHHRLRQHRQHLALRARGLKSIGILIPKWKGLGVGPHQ